MKRRTLHVWLALLAILFAALAPSISHALAAPVTSVETMQVCTASGLQAMPVSRAYLKKVAGDPVMHAFEHCPYCYSHAGAFALLPGATMGFALAGGHDVFPPLYYRAPHTLFLWSSGNPRAPPFPA